VVGIGPGDPEDLSLRAYRLLREADVVIGYHTYLRLLEGVLSPAQHREGSGMRQEVERAQRALELAGDGCRVAVVSSGDPGVYGMAGLVLEVLLSSGLHGEIDFQVVPGITVALAAAGLVGAPLMNDFAVISLSDIMTPWEVILRRIEAAAAGDFVIVFYNPKSRRRVTQITAAQKLLLRYRSPTTPVAIITNAGRTGEQVVLSDLAHFTDMEINMSSLVIVGNSQTYVKEGYLITPRGYQL